MGIHFKVINDGKYKYELLQTEFRSIDIPESVFMPYFDLHAGILTAKKGYRWDGASGPAIDTTTFIEASLFHDVLYQMFREGLLSRKYRRKADKLMRKIALEKGMSRPRAWWTFWAVRLFARGNAK